MTTLTSGKAAFDDLYNAQDVQPYIQGMENVGYQIGDNAAGIMRRVIQDVFRPSCVLNASCNNQAKPLVVELCAGYGLTMIPLRTTLAGADVFEYFRSKRTDIDQAFDSDHQKFGGSASTGMPSFEVFALDVATNALEYGHRTGLFEEIDGTLSNLEADGQTLDAKRLKLSLRQRDAASITRGLATGSRSGASRTRRRRTHATLGSGSCSCVME